MKSFIHRNIFVGMIFSLSLCIASPNSPYQSQFKQDEYVHTQFFKQTKKGIFVDIGAHDGVRFSNSYFFEKTCGWTGLCIEPMPEVFAMLQKARSCDCVNCCVAPTREVKKFMQVITPEFFSGLSGLIENYDPRHMKRIDRLVKKTGGSKKVIEVECYPLMRLLELHKIDHIDFLSIDTEGGELEILKSIDFKKVFVDVITVENNYDDTSIREFLTKAGFVFQTQLVCDEVYRNAQSIKK